MFKFEAGENFNRRNTLSILRIKFEPNEEIGQKGVFCKGLATGAKPQVSFFNRLHSKKQVLII